MPENAWVFKQSRRPVVPSSRCPAVSSSRSPVVSQSRSLAVPSSRRPVVPSSRCLAVPSSRRPVVSLSRRLAVPSSRCLVVPSSRSLAVPRSRRLVVSLARHPVVPSHSQSFSVFPSQSHAPANRAPSPPPNSYLIAPIYDLFSPFISQILKKIKKSCVRIFTDQNYFITLPRFCGKRKPLAEEPQNWHPRISRWLSQIPRFLQTKRC